MARIGAYPDDAYYDPNRPSWLPYWIDTPTESDMKYGGANIIQDTVNAAGMATGEVTGAVANTVGTAAGNAIVHTASNLNLTGLAVVGVLAFIAYKKFIA